MSAPPPAAPPPASAQAWLAAARRQGTTVRGALAAFERLAPVAPAGVVGRWRGAGVATGHPWDGLLEACGWYGKAVRDAETVHPLLFGPTGALVIDAGRLPLGRLVRFHWRQPRLPALAFRVARPLLRTRAPTARLRPVAYRGGVSTAIVYDRQPVIDHLRRVDADCLFGLMDCRYFELPLFFALYRA